jgi:hypothetical protein
MSTPDITKAISANDIKNGASVLLVNKTGTEVLFDSSRDTEQGLEVLAAETTDRFNDRTYYFPSSTSSDGSALILKSTNSSGNEGGEIQLAKPANSSLNGSVIVDVYQNRLRIFEGDGNSRGGYFDLTTMGNNASTNLFGIPSNTGLVPNSTSITNIVSISQSNYDNLATKNANTLYIIRG